MRSEEMETRKPNLDSLERRRKRPNPLTSLVLLLDRENLIVSLSGGLLYAGFASVTSVLASQLQQRYGYDAVGQLFSRTTRYNRTRSVYIDSTSRYKSDYVIFLSVSAVS